MEGLEEEDEDELKGEEQQQQQQQQQEQGDTKEGGAEGENHLKEIQEVEEEYEEEEDEVEEEEEEEEEKEKNVPIGGDQEEEKPTQRIEQHPEEESSVEKKPEVEKQPEEEPDGHLEQADQSWSKYADYESDEMVTSFTEGSDDGSKSNAWNNGNSVKPLTSMVYAPRPYSAPKSSWIQPIGRSLGHLTFFVFVFFLFQDCLLFCHITGFMSCYSLHFF